MLAPIQMTDDYIETKNYGKGINFSFAQFDVEASRVKLILVLVDENGDAVIPKRFVEIDANKSGAKVRKLNGDIKTIPALTYEVLKVASDTGSVGLIKAIFAEVPVDTFPSGI